MIFPIICYHLSIIKQGTMVRFSFYSTAIIPNGAGDCQWWLRGRDAEQRTVPCFSSAGDGFLILDLLFCVLLLVQVKHFFHGVPAQHGALHSGGHVGHILQRRCLVQLLHFLLGNGVFDHL